MDSSWMARIERRQRRLLLLAGLAVLLATGPFVTWVVERARGETTTAYLRAERVLVAGPDGGPTVEITRGGLKLVGADPRDTAYLAPGRDGLSITEPGSNSWLMPGALEVADHGRGRVELKHGLVMLLGGAEGQTDVGPGFVSVSGADGGTVISGRKDALGLNVRDGKTNEVRRWSR